MKKLCLLLFTGLFGALATAQQTQPTKSFDLRLADQLHINTTSLNEVKQLLGEPAYISEDRLSVQYTSGKTICMLNFSRNSILNSLLLTNSEKNLFPLDYIKAREVLPQLSRETLLKTFGSPAEIQITAEQTLWWYRTGFQNLGVIFRGSEILFNYNAAENLKTAFTLADIDFLNAGKTTITELAAKLGAPYSLQYTNEGEERIYRNDRLQLRLTVDSNNIISSFLLEGNSR